MDKYQSFFEEVVSSMNVFGMKDLAINGRDLMAAGISPSPELGACLKVCLQAVCDGKLENNRDALLEFALNYNGEHHNSDERPNNGEHPAG